MKNDPLYIARKLIYELESIQQYLNTTFYYSFEIERIMYGGVVVYAHAPGLPLRCLFETSKKYRFTEIGIYPWWEKPGLSLSMRKMAFRRIWVSMRKGHYLPLANDFIWEV